ncbi:conserved hypothetical protein, partial [Trichinella spiralis]
MRFMHKMLFRLSENILMISSRR